MLSFSEKKVWGDERLEPRTTQSKGDFESHSSSLRASRGSWSSSFSQMVWSKIRQTFHKKSPKHLQVTQNFCRSVNNLQKVFAKLEKVAQMAKFHHIWSHWLLNEPVGKDGSFSGRCFSERPRWCRWRPRGRGRPRPRWKMTSASTIRVTGSLSFAGPGRRRPEPSHVLPVFVSWSCWGWQQDLLAESWKMSLY